MIGRSIVATTVRSSAATNTAKPTTASTACVARPPGDSGSASVEAGRGRRIRSSSVSALQHRPAAGRSRTCRRSLELEHPVGGRRRRTSSRTRRQSRGRCRGSIQKSIATSWSRTSPARDDLHLRRRRHAADVVALAATVLVADELGVRAARRSADANRARDRRTSTGRARSRSAVRSNSPVTGFDSQTVVVEGDRAELGLQRSVDLDRQHRVGSGGRREPAVDPTRGRATRTGRCTPARPLRSTCEPHAVTSPIAAADAARIAGHLGRQRITFRLVGTSATRGPETSETGADHHHYADSGRTPNP